MSLFDDICLFFNPQVKETYEDLYKNYRKGLEFYSAVSEGKSKRIVSSCEMSYSDMKRFYDDQEAIRSHHELCVQLEKAEYDYQELEKLQRLYPHAFVYICNQCLGGIIYDSNIEMPSFQSSTDNACSNEDSTPIPSRTIYPKSGGTPIIVTIVPRSNPIPTLILNEPKDIYFGKKYYDGQFNPVGSDSNGEYCSFGNIYKIEPRRIRELNYPDVLKILQQKDSFSYEERNILSLLRSQTLQNQDDQYVKRENEISVADLKKCVSNWYTHSANGTVKHKWFCDYYSYNVFKNAATTEMWDTWKFIWNFKNEPERHIPRIQHQLAVEKAVQLVKNTLKASFGNEVSKLTLVCLTASTHLKNERRFKLFAETLCYDLDMCNAYSHINLIFDGEAKHEGGTVTSEKSYDISWFKGKYIVLFDDVRTSGRSIEREKRVLEGFGATVICAITLGQTTN